MAVAPFTLTQALQAMGVAEILIGDPLVASGLTSLGAVEGTVEFGVSQNTNPLTAPELTGDTAHASTTTLGEVTARASVIMGDVTLYSKISPWGSKSGGHSVPQNVLTTSVVIMPRAELGGGLAYDGTTWTRTAGNGVAAATGAAAAPKNTIWIWKAYPTFGNLPFQYGNGGKVSVEVTFHAMFDAAKPEGAKVYTIGDPTTLTPTVPVRL